MQKTDPNRALIYLRGWNHSLTPQQFKTLRGQILAGDPDGAMKGLQRILKEQSKKEVRP